MRYLLLPALLLEGRDQEAGQLLARYQEDASATWAYGRALWTFRRERAGPAARRALRAALRENPHVPRYLLAEAEEPGPLPAGFSPRSPEEARVCAEELGEAWRLTPDARTWLRTERAKLSRAPGRRKRRR